MNAVPHTVYAVKALIPNGLYKIGSTSNVERRLRHIRNASPVEMELVGTIPGDRTLERRIHASLLSSHVRCEWFLDTPEVRSTAKAISEGTLDIESLPKPKGVTSFINGKPRPQGDAA